MAFPSRPPRQRERAEQAAIVRLLRSLGATVYTLGTTRRKGDFMGTMQTPGLPDLIAFIKRKTWLDVDTPLDGITRRVLFIECKAKGGRLRPEQAEFRALTLQADVAHVVGGVDEVIAWLIDQRYLKADQVAHYRQPATAATETTHAK